MIKKILLIIAATWSAGVCAQNAEGLAQGLGFANSIKPSSERQIVNPSAVSASSWSSATVPSSAPTDLGNFSKADTATNASLYSNAKGIGLATLGDQKQVDCATFVPGTDDVQNQACAAVNFLSNRCMGATGAQADVLHAAGMTRATASDCAGSYGQSVSTHGYAAAITEADPVFSGLKDLRTTASTLKTVCALEKITTPATYTTATCVANTTVSQKSCAKYLNATITTVRQTALSANTCPTGILIGDICQATTTIAATPIPTCPAGTTLSGTSCITTVSSVTPTYQCGAGYTFDDWRLGAWPKCVREETTSANVSYPPVTSCPVYRQQQLFVVDGYCYVQSSSYYEAAQIEAELGMVIVRTFDSGGSDYFPQYLLARTVYSCQANETLSGTTCMRTSITQATINGYTCPSGGTVSGASCITTATAGSTNTCPNGGTLSGGVCVTVTNTPATVVYSCSDGSVPVDRVCYRNDVAQSWTSTCGIFEAAAGVTLPTP